MLLQHKVHETLDNKRIGTNDKFSVNNSVPENLHFEIDDCEAKWLWPESNFDFIHSRYLIASIGNWASLIRKAYK